MAAALSIHAQTAVPLSLESALELIDAAERKAASEKLRVSVAVVDSRGDLIAFARMPGASAATTDLAIGKAMVSAIFSRASGAFGSGAAPPVFQGLNESTGGRLRFVQGGMPIVRNGFTVGAIAASGATGQQDEDIVKGVLGLASSERPVGTSGQRPEGSKGIWRGVYTDPQAERGKKGYVMHCGGCHGSDLTGGGFAPPLTGETFIEPWTGRTLEDLFKRVRDTMPPNSGDSLESATYLDIVTFLLRSNEFPPGEAELPSDPDVLQKIEITSRRSRA